MTFNTTEAREYAKEALRIDRGNAQRHTLIKQLLAALDHIEQLKRGIRELEKLSSSESLTFSYGYQRMPLIDVVLKLAESDHAKREG